MVVSKHNDLEMCREATEWILARTVAIYFRMPGGNPVMRGSGVLVKIADVGFVLSASHVLDIANDEDATLLVAPMVDRSRSVPVSEAAIAFTTDQHDLDIGAIRLSQEATEQLGQRKKFLRLSELDLRSAQLPQGRHFIAGYPIQLIQADHASKEISIGQFSYWTHLVPSNHGKPGVSVSCAFQSPTVWDRNDVVQRAPHLGGVSGCGIWRLWTNDRHRLLKDWTPEWIRLVGIEHAVVENKEIRGTLISHVVQLIADNFQDMRASIRLAL
jgi:hypothetical protein